MQSEKLPIGIQSFEKLRTGEFIYIDKTSFIARMASQGGAFFLSRPRRFGKSLLLDTMEQAFSGRRELFAGLYLDSPESQWDWSRTHPVVRISFGTGSYRTIAELHRSVMFQIEEVHQKLGLPAPDETLPSLALRKLVKTAAEKTGTTVVVLIDEYDKPILDALPDIELSTLMRSELRSFYGVLKDADPYLRFVFLTGVSKFSKAGVFSGLNQLNDLTLDSKYGAVCGYTQADVDSCFAPLIPQFSPQTIHSWYNGYNWGNESVYNPFDVLLLCDKQELRPWWFETGTPSFLIKMMREQPRSLPELDTLQIGAELSDSFEPETMSLPVMLFQTGYLTIKERIADPVEGTRFRLGFPNMEVRSAFSRLSLVQAYGQDAAVSDNRNRLRDVLEAGDSTALRALFTAFFASIPLDNYRNNTISHYEGFYASVVYAYFASLGLTVIPEDVTNRGRIDLTVIGPKGIWIFEFKVKGLDKSGDEAPLAQILRKGYGAKYQGRLSSDGQSLPIRLIGIIFDEVERNVVGWEEA
ncbi:MAG: ATP-binding protein [Rectinemataceae bacterium]